MKCNLKKILFLPVLFLCALFLTTAFPVTVNADTGPKPSVCIDFENMGDELCYATLLSETPSTGPHSVWDGDEEHIYDTGIDLQIWRAFVNYEDADGFYFLQIDWQVNETKEFAWTYYPPDTFKILLYYPEKERFAVSEICKRYAFDTYYTVDMSGLNIGSAEYDGERSNDDRLEVRQSYEYRREIPSLVVRILLTIAIETCVALLFGFRGKKALLCLVGVNTVTQIALNVLLNVIAYTFGSQAFVWGYIVLELAVFAAEAAFYCALMNKFTEKPKKNRFYILYALVANAVSFGAGLLIANIFPWIF